MPGIGINPIVVSKGGGTCTSRAWVRNPDWLDFPATSEQEVYHLQSVRYGYR